MKLNRYGDRLLETIEATIREHNKEKNSSSSNDSLDSKRRRDAASIPDGNDDFTESTARSKKRLVKKQDKTSKQQQQQQQAYQFELGDIDFDDDLFDVEVDQSTGGTVLPSWSGSTTNGSQLHA